VIKPTPPDAITIVTIERRITVNQQGRAIIEEAATALWGGSARGKRRRKGPANCP
jgi:hypothetical protein